MKEMQEEILPCILAYDAGISRILREHGRIVCRDSLTQFESPYYEPTSNSCIYRWFNVCSTAIITFKFTEGDRFINVGFYSFIGNDSDLQEAFKELHIPGFTINYLDANTAQIVL